MFVNLERRKLGDEDRFEPDVVVVVVVVVVDGGASGGGGSGCVSD